MKKNLIELYSEHTGKVSDKWSLYFEVYDRIFKDKRNDSLSMLEIGIQNGGSLEIWAQFFPNASAIIGCDINKKCLELNYSVPSIRLFVGDANEHKINQGIIGVAKELDIVIDDGSHQSSDIIKSFSLYFPLLTSGGIYIAEDLHCSYWKPFGGGLRSKYSSIEFFKRLVDIVNFEHWTSPESKVENLRFFQEQYGCTFRNEDLACIHSIEFVNSMCIVRKKDAIDNMLGKRVVVGADASIVSEVTALNNCPYKLDPNLIEKPGLFNRFFKYFR